MATLFLDKFKNPVKIEVNGKAINLQRHPSIEVDEDIEIIATYEDVEIPEAKHFTKRMREELNDGRYEKQEVRLALATVKPSDHVLEMGAGGGIVGAITAKNCNPAKMWSYEANPELIPHIQNLYNHNELEDTIQIHNQIVVTDPSADAEMDFFLMGNFLGSGVEAKNPDRARKVSVKTVQFDDIRAALKPTVLLMDIEGFELQFFESANLDDIRLVVVELHPKIYGRKGKRHCVEALERSGLHPNFDLSKGGVFVFEREV